MEGKTDHKQYTLKCEWQKYKTLLITINLIGTVYIFLYRTVCDIYKTAKTVQTQFTWVNIC